MESNEELRHLITIDYCETTMTTPIAIPFDAAEFLDNEEVIAAYLQDALEDDNPDVFLQALSDVARARGMSHVAESTGMGRESLYKTLRPGSKPGFLTISKVVQALGVKLSLLPVTAIAKGPRHRTRAAKGA